MRVDHALGGLSSGHRIGVRSVTVAAGGFSRGPSLRLVLPAFLVHTLKHSWLVMIGGLPAW
jgi:hypothetical protein